MQRLEPDEELRKSVKEVLTQLKRIRRQNRRNVRGATPPHSDLLSIKENPKPLGLSTAASPVNHLKATLQTNGKTGKPSGGSSRSGGSPPAQKKET